jgi:hypothetical protein
MLYAAYEHLEEVSFGDLLASAPTLDVVMLPSIAGRLRATIPPATFDRPTARGSSASVLSGLARITSPMTDAPTMVARTTRLPERTVDSRTGGYRNRT